MAVTAYLLDASVLIALIDPAHIHHDPAHDWFAASGHKAWATCPLTENAVLRIVGHARYPNSPGTPAMVAPLMASLCALPGHVFWPDDISMLDPNEIHAERLLSSSQVTGSYLLALASSKGGQLATFDRHLVTDAVPGGKQGLCLLN